MSIDSITLTHTDLHPEQRFSYEYNVLERVLQNIEAKHIILLFDGRIGEHVSTKVLLGATPEDYYIAVMDVANSFFVPHEWYKLKSFVDGKKKYIH